MKLNELLKTVQPVQVIGNTDIEITGVDIDSRRVETGHLFMAMRGTQTDGHAYIPAAIRNGACAIVCEELPAETQEGIAYVVVKDSEDATGRIATLFYGDPTSRLELVGVTGTNGKTTTATLLYRLFRYFGYKVGLISTVCNYIDDEAVPTEHTTPDPITLNQLLGRMADAGCQYAFMEVSSHAIAQKRISGLRFAGGIFTNLTRDHLDYHKTVDNYIRAKKKFFDDMPRDAFSLVNVDDKNGMVMVQNTRSHVHTYSLRSLCDFKGRVLESHFEGMLLDFNGHEVAVSFVGRFNAYNLLAVFGAAVLLGQKPEEVLIGLSTLHPVSGRFETLRSPQGFTAIVDYAHTPDALVNVLNAIHGVLDHHRRRRRRQPRQGQAPPDGQGGSPPERPAHHHQRQSPLRGTAGHHPRYAGRTECRGPAEDSLHRRPPRGHPHRLHAGRTGRRRPGGRQGTRGLSGGEGREAPLRRQGRDFENGQWLIYH